MTLLFICEELCKCQKVKKQKNLRGIEQDPDTEPGSLIRGTDPLHTRAKLSRIWNTAFYNYKKPTVVITEDPTL